MFHEELSQAAAQGDGSPLVQQVDDHFGGGHRGVGCIYKGQVCEKEIHGSQKCGAEGDGNNNEQIGQHSK